MSYVLTHKITEHFSFEEFFKSETAKSRKINNFPITLGTIISVCDNISKIAVLLEIVRAVYGDFIAISSGYRNEQLNKIVGGVNNSYHLRGAAADIYGKNMVELGNSLKKVQSLVYFAPEKSNLFRIVPENVVNGVPSWYHIQLETCTSKMSIEYLFNLFEL